MSAKYICELCNQSFNKKIDYTKHKKTHCVSINKIQKSNINIKNIDYRSNLATIFRYCLDVLRDNEHLTGDKALRTLSHLLILRLLEPKIINKEIDIDNYEYNFEEYEYTDEQKKQLFSLVRFSNLANSKEDNMCNRVKAVWDIILSQYPKTQSIFLKNKGFDIKNQSTFAKLFKKLNDFYFEEIEVDVQGECYEEVIKDIMTGKVLGQFFTPPCVKQIMVELVQPKIIKHTNKDIGYIFETIFDPAMGTGGFLITALRYLLKQAKNNNIILNPNFIIEAGLGGRECEPDTFQLAKANMLISSGHMLNNLEFGDSIREHILTKYDIVLTNPPFGIKELNYDEFNHKYKNDCLPIKSSSAVPLFLQLVIYILKINGRCAIVLPNGQELFSKNIALVSIREYLMKTCELKEIIYLPSGIFTHTSIKTCIFYFIKKKNGKDIVEVKKSFSSKTQKEIKRIYKFNKEHQTKNIKFYDYDIIKKEKKLIIDVDIKNIIDNHYSLNYNEYLEESEEECNNEVEIKTLGEVCEFQNGKQLSKNKFVSGNYPVIGGGKLPCGYHNKFNREPNTILCSSSGSSGYISKYNTNIWASDCFSIHSYNKNLLDEKYLYYYLKYIQNTIYKLQIGVAQPHVYSKDISVLKIPIPLLEKQKEIVEQLDFIYEKCIKTSEDKILQLKQLNKMCLDNQIKFRDNDIKILGEVCEFDKNLIKHPTSYGQTSGKYKFYTGGRRTDLYVNNFDIDDLYIIQNRTNGSGKCNLYLAKHFSLANQTIAYISKNKSEITTKYIYYYFKHNIYIIEKGYIGSNHKNISKEYLQNIKIPIPLLEKQKEIIIYCEDNDNLIKQLKNEIIKNKELANKIISQVYKKSNINNEIKNSKEGYSNSENE